MFWKNWSWPARIISVLLPLLIFAILFPVFDRARDNEGHHSSCQSNLKQIGLGFAQYEQDYDEKFPLIITGGSAYGWADALQPYLKSTQIYHCPSLRAQEQNKDAPLKDHYTDYPFNANLDRKSVNDVADMAWQILSLDGNDGIEVTNARYCLTQIPPKWRQDQNSPLYRHLNWASYLFADGHVRSLAPSHLEGTNHPIF